jgi:hypothetical protein
MSVYSSCLLLRSLIQNQIRIHRICTPSIISFPFVLFTKTPIHAMTCDKYTECALWRAPGESRFQLPLPLSFSLARLLCNSRTGEPRLAVSSISYRQCRYSRLVTSNILARFPGVCVLGLHAHTFPSYFLFFSALSFSCLATSSFCNCIGAGL